MTTYVKASHILVKTEEEALNLKAEIKTLEDFAKAAQKHSLCPSGQTGGDLGFFGRGKMVREFEEAAFSMEVGEISAPVKTQFGYHLLYLEAKED